mmetsp:Transcript_16814/g.36425  ORF Transcript_16814/g.36425 Transcript_16814/m.36425 type:complete len:231 (-) Transcript_16814:198-890(-)
MQYCGAGPAFRYWRVHALDMRRHFNPLHLRGLADSGAGSDVLHPRHHHRRRHRLAAHACARSGGDALQANPPTDKLGPIRKAPYARAANACDRCRARRLDAIAAGGGGLAARLLLVPALCARDAAADRLRLLEDHVGDETARQSRRSPLAAEAPWWRERGKAPCLRRRPFRSNQPASKRRYPQRDDRRLFTRHGLLSVSVVRTAWPGGVLGPCVRGGWGALAHIPQGAVH